MRVSGFASRMPVSMRLASARKRSISAVGSSAAMERNSKCRVQAAGMVFTAMPPSILFTVVVV